MSGSTTIRVTPEQKAEALRRAARNSQLRILTQTPAQRRAAQARSQGRQATAESA